MQQPQPQRLLVHLTELGPGPLVCGCCGPADSVSPECPYLGLGVQGDDFLVVVQQLAGVGDVDSGFLFVASEDLTLQAGLPQFSYGFGNAILQTVFDPGGTWAGARQCVGPILPGPRPPHASCCVTCRRGPTEGLPPVAALVGEGWSSRDSGGHCQWLSPRVSWKPPPTRDL